MSEATPRPWTREVVRTSIGVCHKIGPFCPSKVTGKENYACIYDDCYSDVPRNEELLANAKLIVRAVNSHDALLEACKHLIDGKVHWSGTAVHPSGFFCSVCGMNSKMVVHAPGCPIWEALSAIAAAEKDVTP